MSYAAFFVTAIAIAAGPSDARDIAQRALENNMFSTSNARAVVLLEVSRDGRVVRERRITTKIKRESGTVRSFVEFLSPADVAGTKFLSVERRNEEADQFIYLPAFKKVKRVVGSQRSQSFMGTDFSYADLEGREADEAVWKRLEDAEIGGQRCYVIEGVPKKKEDRTNERSVLWVHQEHLIPMRIDFYAPGSAEVTKRFTLHRLEKQNGRWIATDSVMATLRRGTHTRLEIVTIDFDTEIPDAELTRQALER